MGTALVKHEYRRALRQCGESMAGGVCNLLAVLLIQPGAIWIAVIAVGSRVTVLVS